LLLHGVFEECNISFSKALCEKLAHRVRATGVGTYPYIQHSTPLHLLRNLILQPLTQFLTAATSKSIQNRLYSWKKKNVGTNPPSATSTPAKAASTSKPPRPKAPATKKSVDTASESSNGGPDGLAESPSISRGSSKRAKSTLKRSYAESTSEQDDIDELYQPLAKRVKAKPVEDDVGYVQFGLRGADDEFEV
jgi:hypothetical protein